MVVMAVKEVLLDWSVAAVFEAVVAVVGVVGAVVEALEWVEACANLDT